MSENVRYIYAPETLDGGEGLIAIVVKHDFREPGTIFFTEPGQPQQLAYMARGKGELVQPHTHRPHSRTVERTQEILHVRKGRIRLDLYTSDQEKFASLVLEPGDWIVLVAGGHAMEMLDDVEMFEIKQGPYYGRALDKIPFRTTPNG